MMKDVDICNSSMNPVLKILCRIYLVGHVFGWISDTSRLKHSRTLTIWKVQTSRAHCVSCKRPWYYTRDATLPKTKIAAENRPKPKRKGSSSKHKFSGAIRSFRGV